MPRTIHLFQVIPYVCYVCHKEYASADCEGIVPAPKPDERIIKQRQGDQSAEHSLKLRRDFRYHGKNRLQVKKTETILILSPRGRWISENKH